ncbi:MAG: acylneuraminate cytidylyltransferase family protein [Phycisphaeraceae bacterium]|nr:acylneuraminate cytidylyltransferase family protein [Phycisphaeraceae bacterium]
MIDQDGALGVILARAGSKGLPNKNSVKIAGKPMLAWTIEHALASTQIGRVLVTTDGEALAQIAGKYDVEVVRRPAELATDTATVDAAARHAVNQVVDTHENVCLLYGNVPVRPADLSDRAIDMLRQANTDSVQSVCPVGKNHPYWMKTVDPETGQLGMLHDNQVYRRQELPPVYMLDGGVIAVKRSSLFCLIEGQPHAFLGSDRRAVVTEPGEVVDIDTQEDLKAAEALLEQRLQDGAIRAVG